MASFFEQIFVFLNFCLLKKVVQPASAALGVNQAFMGLTVIAFVPSFTEFVACIKFALQVMNGLLRSLWFHLFLFVQDNIALSLEVALSYSVQITLLQMPVLVFFSAFYSGESTNSFTLIFKSLDVFAVILSVIVVNYTSQSPRTNYFEG